MPFIVYKTINKLNGKFYIGAHYTKSLETDDGYRGTGTAIGNAIAKYGIENFNRETLHVLPDEDSMYVKEAEIVTEEYLKDPMTYNITLGGRGGRCSHMHTLEVRAMVSETMKLKIKNDPIFHASLKLAGSMSRMKCPHLRYNFKGKHHTDETKEKISATNKIKLLGEGNGMYGATWAVESNASDTTGRKRFLKHEPLPEGWIPIIEWNAIHHPKVTNRSWYNDGVKSFLLSDTDLKVQSLIKGRLV